MDNQKSGFFKWFGSMSGRFYNTHQDWQQAPTWMKESYKLETEQHCGDIDSVFSGALKGVFEGSVEYAKAYPTDAAKMGVDIAEKFGIEPENGKEFAQGFLSTAELEK